MQRSPKSPVKIIKYDRYFLGLSTHSHKIKLKKNRKQFFSSQEGHVDFLFEKNHSLFGLKMGEFREGGVNKTKCRKK